MWWLLCFTVTNHNNIQLGRISLFSQGAAIKNIENVRVECWDVVVHNFSYTRTHGGRGGGGGKKRDETGSERHIDTGNFSDNRILSGFYPNLTLTFPTTLCLTLTLTLCLTLTLTFISIYLHIHFTRIFKTIAYL